MITVACVLRSGGDFGPEDVARLANGVHRNLREAFRFVCLTDQVEAVCTTPMAPQAILVEPLTFDWPGWWAKIEAFRLADDVVLFLDLDTVIVGDLRPIIEAIRRVGCLCLIRDFNRQHLYQTGVMGWTGSMGWPFGQFVSAANRGGVFVQSGRPIPAFVSDLRSYRGDGEWLYTQIHGHAHAVRLLQDETPGIVSYKIHVRGRQLPDNARIVCFHGSPRPKDVAASEPWMAEHWTSLGAVA